MGDNAVYIRCVEGAEHLVGSAASKSSAAEDLEADLEDDEDEGGDEGESSGPAGTDYRAWRRSDAVDLCGLVPGRGGGGSA